MSENYVVVGNRKIPNTDIVMCSGGFMIDHKTGYKIYYVDIKLCSKESIEYKTANFDEYSNIVNTLCIEC